MTSPPVWSSEELEEARQFAELHFREERYTEPLEIYLQFFDEYQAVVEEVLEQTEDLTELRPRANDLLNDSRKFEVLRYLSGPPVSEDDLKVLIQAKSLAASRFKSDPELVDRLIEFIQDCADRRRFPWMKESWHPEVNDRKAAILATSALLATRRLETQRRNQGKTQQEDLVAERLLERFEKVEPRTVKTLANAPNPGEFCRESMFGSRKADFLIGLPDARIMALECKVSNSATNSIKRLNNDAAVKAVTWREEFGLNQVVPAAVLSGVYKLRNLIHAQNMGLALFWAHDMSAMMQWIEVTRSA